MAHSDGATDLSAGESHQQEHAQAFVDAFIAGWKSPENADAFADHFMPWLDIDYYGTVPMLHLGRGRIVFREDFARPLLDLLRNVKGTVTDWAYAGNTVYVELEIDCVIGRSTIVIRVCDRFHLKGGKAARRITYLDDVAPLCLAIVRNPSVWPRALRFLLHSLGPARRRAHRTTSE